jgi:hypothetical protein
MTDFNHIEKVTPGHDRDLILPTQLINLCKQTAGLARF